MDHVAGGVGRYELLALIDILKPAGLEVLQILRGESLAF